MTAPPPSPSSPLEPEKSRAARAGLLHARNSHRAHRSFKQSSKKWQALSQSGAEASCVQSRVPIQCLPSGGYSTGEASCGSMNLSRAVSIRLCTVWLAYRRSPGRPKSQGFFRSSGEIVMAGKPSPPSIYHLRPIIQPTCPTRSPGALGVCRGFGGLSPCVEGYPTVGSYYNFAVYSVSWSSLCVANSRAKKRAPRGD